MKVEVTFLNMCVNPPIPEGMGVIESNHVSAIHVYDRRLFIFLLSGQQLHIVNDKDVYRQLVLQKFNKLD